MNESMYQKWLKEEEKWIGKYCDRTIRSSILKTIPATVLGCMFLLGGIRFLDRGSMEDAMMGVLAGLIFGLIISVFFLLAIVGGLRPAKYVRKIECSVREMHMDEAEREQLGKEMLNALEKSECVIEYKMIAKGKGMPKGTPARFVLTPHYAFLEGSSPYAILVRLSDIAEVRAGFEEKKIDTMDNDGFSEDFTLYTIGFYRKDRSGNGLADNDLPDEAMGFFQQEIRDNVVNMLRNAGMLVSG